ncbi:MAG: class GN sortase [Spirochaetales bacterium]|nr:class GN sortase [Spirochaetales bacterium]
MRKRIIFYCFLFVFCCGLFLAGKGLFIAGKACLAQALLETSWENKVMGKGNRTPWPWADFKPMACLSFPGQKQHIIVVNGASGTSLAFAPGHLDGSAQPGSPGNCVIFGHRETHFRILKDLKIGDTIRLSLADGRLKEYKVNGIQIIASSDVYKVIQMNEELLTLVTCYPFDSVLPGKKRYVVCAKAYTG